MSKSRIPVAPRLGSLDDLIFNNFTTFQEPAIGREILANTRFGLFLSMHCKDDENCITRKNRAVEKKKKSMSEKGLDQEKRDRPSSREDVAVAPET